MEHSIGGFLVGVALTGFACNIDFMHIASRVEIEDRFVQACSANHGTFDAGGMFYRSDGTQMKIDNSCVTDHNKFQTVSEFLGPLVIK